MTLVNQSVARDHPQEPPRKDQASTFHSDIANLASVCH